MSSVKVWNKFTSSSSSSFSKLITIPSRLKRSFSSRSSSSGTPRSSIIQTLSPSVDISEKKLFNSNIKKEDVFKKVFGYFDGDGDGKISSLEIRSYFGSIGEYISHEEAQIVINDLDNDGDGFLDFRDFMVLMMKQPSSSSSSSPHDSISSSSNSKDNDDHDHIDVDVVDDDEDLRMAFEMYEAEKGCGCITPKSLQRMLSRLGDFKSYDQCVSIIQVFDLDKNGTLDFHEFHQMMA